MNENILTKVGLACSIVGLGILYVGAISVHPQPTPIASLDNSLIGVRVTISGEVVDLYEHPNGHLFLKLRDDSGEMIDVPIFSGVRAGLKSIEFLDVVTVSGEVSTYRGRLEVVPEDAEDVKVTHTPPTKLSNITVENSGYPAKVQGTILNRREFSNGSILLTIHEDGSELPVFIPCWISNDKLAELDVGKTLRASGWLQLYKGKIELKVVSSSGLHLVEDA